MRRIGIPVIVAFLAIGFAVWWYSPTQVLRRRTKSLVATLTISASEPVSSRKIRAFKLDPFLDASIEVVAHDIPDLEEPLDRSQINAAFAYFCERTTSSDFTLKKIQAVEIHGDRGRVKALISVTVDAPGGDRGMNGNHEVILSWRDDKDTWKLQVVDWHKLAP